MEITLEAIISIVGLLAGGTGIGGFFVWKYTKRKAQAEAKQAEAEAAKAEATHSDVATVRDCIVRLKKILAKSAEERGVSLDVAMGVLE